MYVTPLLSYVIVLSTAQNTLPFNKSFRAILLRADEQELELVRIKYLKHYSDEGDFMEFAISDYMQPPFHFTTVDTEDFDTPHLLPCTYTIIRSSSPRNHGDKLNGILRNKNARCFLRGDLVIVRHKTGEDKLFETIGASDADQIVFDVANINTSN